MVVIFIKEKEFDQLITEMGECSQCIYLKSKNGKDYSLINIYKNKEFSKSIPSIWTDWYRRLESNILIVGQDWGPYNDMKKLREGYIKDESIDNWIRLIEMEKSNTKKLLTKYLIESSDGKINSIDNIYITNAIMCARKGNYYRGDNINLKVSTLNCSKYLYKQIEIVKPKVVVTLGYYPLLSLSKIFGFKIESNLKQSIIKNPVIKVDGYVIVPLFHPVAQIKREEQLEQYKHIWEYV